MQFKWEPKGVFDDDGNDVGELFEGHVIIDVLPKTERLRMATELQTEIKSDGTLDLSQIDKLEKMGDIVNKCVKQVSLKAGGYEIKSMNDLESFAEGVHLSNHILGICINGFSLGKPLKKKSAKPASS